MFEKIGGLQKFWFIIAFSKELPKKTFLERKIYDIPLLLWCDKNNQKFCFINVCPHKKGKLMVKNFETNEISCKYHGWEFDKNGNLENIPSNPEIVKKMLGCHCKALKVLEKDGFIYINFSENPDENLIPDFSETKNYKIFSKNILFETDEDFLIENFMDATHTPFVHNKIIRDQDKKFLQKIKIVKKGDFLKAYFADSYENIGLGFNKFFKNSLKISHTDEFLLPNIVKVDYSINEIHRFQAIIACTQIENGKTMAFVKISYKFGFFNFLLKILLPIYAKKVLLQDFDVTKEQFENYKYFPNVTEKHIEYDILHNQMRLIRKNIMIGRENTSNFEKEIQIMV